MAEILNLRSTNAIWIVVLLPILLGILVSFLFDNKKILFGSISIIALYLVISIFIDTYYIVNASEIFITGNIIASSIYKATLLFEAPVFIGLYYVSLYISKYLNGYFLKISHVEHCG